jgi:hypothetical protein
MKAPDFAANNALRRKEIRGSFMGQCLRGTQVFQAETAPTNEGSSMEVANG